jgi:Na+/proline symporter
VNFLFLSLGALLFIFARQRGITLPAQTDDLFPVIATTGYLGPAVAVFFIVGLVAAAYSSADSALTSLTTSFTVDILNGAKLKEDRLQRLRKRVHIGISLVLLLVILIFRLVNNQNVITAIFTAAGYTYGPLLGFYSFGLFTPFKVKDRWVPLVAICAPVASYVISHYSAVWFGGYEFGFELLLLNGLLTFAGLFLIRRKSQGLTAL